VGSDGRNRAAPILRSSRNGDGLLEGERCFIHIDRGGLAGRRGGGFVATRRGRRRGFEGSMEVQRRFVVVVVVVVISGLLMSCPGPHQLLFTIQVSQVRLPVHS
jgi:hypothetical protein